MERKETDIFTSTQTVRFNEDGGGGGVLYLTSTRYTGIIRMTLY